MDYINRWDHLPDDCLHCILSFAGNILEGRQCRLDPILFFYQSYANVSTQWWRVTREWLLLHQSTHGVALDLGHLLFHPTINRDIEPFRTWFCDPRLIIRQLCCSDWVTLGTRLLEECDTTRLEHCQTLFNADSSIVSPLLNHLHETMATQCPELKSLSVLLTTADREPSTTPTGCWFQSPFRTLCCKERTLPEHDFGRLVHAFPRLVKLTLDAIPGTCCRPRAKLAIRAKALESLEICLSLAFHSIVDHLILDCPNLRTIVISAKNHHRRELSIVAIPFVAGELGAPWHPAMYPRGAVLRLERVHPKCDMLKKLGDDGFLSVWDDYRYGLISDRTWVVLAWC